MVRARGCDLASGAECCGQVEVDAEVSENQSPPW